jgi:HlyD family secretion protein
MERKSKWRRWAAVMVVIAAGSVSFWTVQQRGRLSAAPQPVAAASGGAADSPGAIGCLGRYKPEDGIVRVAAPYYQSRPSVVAKLLAREGEWVKSGQTIAYLDGKPQVEAELARVAAQLELARAKVVQARAGAKPGDLEAQRATIARLEVSYRQQQSEFQRYQTLARTDDVSASDLEARRTSVETAGKAVDEARHRLAAMSEFREQDVHVAEAEMQVAEAQLRETDARLAGLTVAVPSSGRVIKVNTRAGEEAGQDGILDMADTNRMAVEAEVYAADVAAVHAGQNASIQPEGGAARLTGVVTRVGQRVQQASVLPGDPTSYSDAHVVPVQIRVPGCRNAVCPINARVKVTIETAR